MAERFGARLNYEDELVAEMRQCEEQLELMYLKRKQRKQQKERDEEQQLKEEEERRARKAAKKEEERRARKEEKKRLIREEIRQLELAEQRQQEAMRREDEERRARKAAKQEEERRVKIEREMVHQLKLAEIEETIRQREREFQERKQLDTMKLQQMKEEMERVQNELKTEMAKRDRAKKARHIKRKEAEAQTDLERIESETSLNDEMKCTQTDVELFQSKDRIELDKASITVVNTLEQPISLCIFNDVEETHPASMFEPCNDVTKTEVTLIDVPDAVPDIVIFEDLALPEPITVTDEKYFDNCRGETQLSAPSDEQASYQHQSTHHRCDDCRNSDRYSIDVLDARSSSDVTALCQADISHKIPDLVEQAGYPVISYLPDSHESVDCLVDAFQQRPVEVEQVATSVMSYLSDPHANHTVQIVLGPVEVEQVATSVMSYLSDSHANHTVQIVLVMLLYCYASTLVSKIFYCVSLCLLYVMYCSILLRYCTYLSPCSELRLDIADEPDTVV